MDDQTDKIHAKPVHIAIPMIIKLILILLVALALFFVVWRFTDSPSKDDSDSLHRSADGNGEDNAGGDFIDTVPAVDVPAKASIEAVGNLPLWFEFEPTESNPAIYENVYWEVEPSGEYIYYLAGDYEKNKKGHLRHRSPTTVFSVLTSFESDAIDANKHDHGYAQTSAEQSTVDIADYINKTVGVVMDLFKDALAQDLSNTQYVSLMPLMPAGALGNARLLVSENWVNGDGGVKLSLIYEEFRTPESTEELERMVWIEAHAMNREQSVETLVNHFVSLVDRYKNMPYVSLSGATRY